MAEEIDAQPVAKQQLRERTPVVDAMQLEELEDPLVYHAPREWYSIEMPIYRKRDYEKKFGPWARKEEGAKDSEQDPSNVVEAVDQFGWNAVTAASRLPLRWKVTGLVVLWVISLLMAFAVGGGGQEAIYTGELTNARIQLGIFEDRYEQADADREALCHWIEMQATSMEPSALEALNQILNERCGS